MHHHFMKINLVLAILFLTSCTLRKKDYAPTHEIKDGKFGVGLLHITVKEQNIPLLDTGNNKTPFDTIMIRKVFPKSNDSPFEFKTSILNQDLRPYGMYGGHIPTKNDYLKEIAYIPIELTFRVIKKVNNYYYIIVNEEDNRIAIIENLSIKESTDCIFETWESHLKSAESLEIEQGDQYPIYNRPDGHTIKITFNVKFKIIEIKGYWLKITAITEKKQGKSYWIKWRDDNKAFKGIILNFENYRTYI